MTKLLSVVMEAYPKLDQEIAAYLGGMLDDIDCFDCQEVKFNFFKFISSARSSSHTVHIELICSSNFNLFLTRYVLLELFLNRNLEKSKSLRK